MNAPAANDLMLNEDLKEQSVRKKYDLREKTAKFGKNIINFAKTIPENSITRPLIGICRRESKESKHWLSMVTEAVPSLKSSANLLS
jgi:hypothetical protein